ncbi:thiol:disulfide interchange protein DsbA/DsbL [Rhodanobacter glycinis]|uniref:Thiol:disulfide interchange protein n=1 Tax=Rhodanobacter glycinis TaxID=582702 RepID=A0A1I4APG8_9GAMM|nr:thiol:disulfide interchange protein DsbA/DsbL [Rhodanobacter glycinis]QEE23571.1 thiol:disulfide interchange protein DsbA/DsbL [Rhodanobacter glycinis]TAM33623.1 MAG: thiol:disulfide interchange protein DsbA/DsbL [Rhodanobacter sp.]SFK58375.1 Thiol:disulfide interchange protein DsbA [Rhodanobacter glycinis]
MSKRFVSMRMLALLGGLVLASACSAASNSATAPYTNGDEYVTLPGPHQRYSNDGKVEVVEVFSYACIHCAEFAPDAEKLRKALPPGVKFKLLPAPFNQAWLPYARAFYAAKQLGVVQQTHLKLFVEKFAQHYPLNSLDDLADFYARQGVNRAKFMQIATSPEATTALKADLALIQKWGVDATPTIVVDGKYRSNNITSYSQLVALTQWLVKRELAEKGGK